MGKRAARRVGGLGFTAAFATLVFVACVTPATSDDGAGSAGDPPLEGRDASAADATIATSGVTSDAESTDEDNAEGLVETEADPTARESRDFVPKPLTSDAGPPSPSVGSFAVYATEAFEMNGSALVTGCNVGVQNTTGPFLGGGAAAYFNSGAHIDTTQTLYAYSVYLNSGVTLGALDTNHVLGNPGATYGTVSSFPAMPAAPTLPAATAGTTNIQLNSGTRTIAAGAYGSVTLNSGTTLTLTGGGYVFASLTMNGGSLVVTAPTTLSVTGASSWGSGAFIGPASGSGLTAKALQLFFNSSSGINLNSNVHVQALVVATNALVTVNTSSFTGALAAAQVVMNSGATITCQDSFGATSCSGSCDDSNTCTTDACNAGSCTHTPVANGTSCSDGNACTQSDSCQSGTCTGANPVSCAASDQCHGVGTCNTTTGACSNPIAANGTSCSDGNACTQSDSCQSGACTGSNPVTCTAPDQCHGVGTCNTTTGACSNPIAANGTSCSDGNACTQSDSCQSGTCTGSNPVTCVASDACHVAGTCAPATGTCSNPTAANGTSCSDGNACTQSDSCQSGTCTGSNPVSCTASDQCHGAGTCDTTTGACSNPTLANGTSCSDGSACTQSDSCQSGTCTGSNPVTCTAVDACHVAGACDPSTGACSNPAAPDGLACADGNACTQTDVCAAGLCVGSNPVTCVAIDSCHAVGTCDAASGLCTNPAVADGTSCNDGNACDSNDTCQSGACTAGSHVTCAPSDQCHAAGTCDPTTGVCSNPVASDGTSCNDGNACDSNDTCQLGACVPGNTVTCTASDQCHVTGSCDPASGQCSSPAATDGTSCSDGSLCVFAGSESCVGGGCVGTPKCGGAECVSSQCDPSSGACAPAIAGTPCSGGACDGNGTCATGTAATHVIDLIPLCPPASTACSIGPGVYDSRVHGCYYVPAPAGTTCESGVCDGDNHCVASSGSIDAGASYVAVLGAACPPANECANPGSIDFATGACVYVALDAGTACTGGTCDGDGQCSAASSDAGVADSGSDAGADAGPSACDDSNPCTVDKRNADLSCSHYLYPDDTSCNDGNKCDSNDTCQAGACRPGATVTCTASDQCHAVGTCNPSTGVCSNPLAADGTSCTDGNACTQSDTCVSGACTGASPVTCTASDACHVAGSCNTATGGCSNPAAADGTSCSDGNACTQTDACLSGTCAGSNPVTCAAADQCHLAGACDPSSGACSNPSAANGTACSDGNACTTSDACTNGACAGAAVTCSALDACHVAGSCDVATGACSNPPASAGVACGNNSNLCVGAFLCSGSGTCVQGPPPVIDNSNPCLVGSCNPATGVSYAPAPVGTACADSSNLCVGAYACNASAACVQGPAPVIDTSNPCVVGSCDPATGVTYTPNPGAACGDNSNRCATTFVCNAGGSCQTIPPPVISPPNVCTPGTCDPTTGVVTYTPIAGCDPNPTTGNAFEPQASVIGKVVRTDGTPVTGYTITVFDDVATGTPRPDVSATTASDGSFRARLTTFPTSEPDRTPPHHVVIQIDGASSLSAYRNVYLHPGMAVNVGTINLVPLDPNVVVIGAAGGTVIDSQGLVELDIPAGAITTPTPVRITAFRSRNDLAYPLPDVTIAGYAMDFEPDGLQLQVPATVHLVNWRNVPTNISIPVGVLNRTDGTWSHETFANWDGHKFVFSITHFSDHDINPPTLGEWILSFLFGKHEGSSAKQCGGSTFGLANGTLGQNFTLPAVTRRGQAFSVGLNYDSRLTFGASDTSSPSASVGSVPATGISATGAGLGVRMSCMSAPAAEKILSTSPGTCGGGGGCSLGGTGAGMPTGMNLHTVTDTTITDTTVDVSGNSLEFDTTLPFALPTAGNSNSIAGSGYYPVNVSVQMGGPQCSGGGAGFGITQVGPNSPSPETTDPGTDPTVLASVPVPSFIYHRHSSPYGIGWGINDVGHVYVSPSKSDAVLVTGEGDEEDFEPRVSVTGLGGAFNGAATYAHALDPVTAEVFRVSQTTNKIELVNTANGTATTVLSGLALPSQLQMMSVGYVGGVRHFLLALVSGLLDVDASGNKRTLMARPTPPIDPGAQYFFFASSAAIVGHYAYYTTGTGEVANADKTPLLYRLDLTVATPSAETISGSSTGTSNLGAAVSGFAFGDPHGLAPAPDGGLYVADRQRNRVFEVKPNASGAVAGDSLVASAFGSGNGHVLSPLGQWQAGAEFNISQPGYLFNGPDGVLWIFTSYGAATFDPLRNEARWLIFDSGVPNQETNFSFYAGPTVAVSSFIPVGPLAVFGTVSNAMYRFDVEPLSSLMDPTRTLSLGSTITLTDTTRDLVEIYDAGGRLLQRQSREGDPLFSVTYVGTSDTIQSIVDPVGGAWTFAYSNGLLTTITDSAGRATAFGYTNADVTGFTQPDGETWLFEYTDHHMTKKTSPEGDVTTYAYNATTGALSTITKPANETYSISPGYFQPPGHDSIGRPLYTTAYTDPRGVTHTSTVDEFGRPLTEQYTADGTNYTVKHDRFTFVGSTADPFTNRGNRFVGRDARIEVNGIAQGSDDIFDKLGRWIGSPLPTGTSIEQTVGYDGSGRVASYSPGSGDFMDTFNVTRDGNGRPTKIAQSATRETDFTWNTDGTLATSTVHGVTTTYHYDPTTLNVASTSDTIGRTTTFTYDAAGNVMTASNGSTTPVSGDGATTWTFGHDLNNRLTTATDASGNVTTLGYVQRSCGCSEADLLTSLQTPDLTSDGKAWEFDYGNEGRLAAVTDPDGHAETYAYELAGELHQLVDRNGHGTTITHDSLGRVLAITDALGRAHARAYAKPSSGVWSGQDVLSGSGSGTAAGTDFTKPLAAGEYQIGTNAYDLVANPGVGNLTRGWADIQFYRDATFQLSYGRQVDIFGRTTQTFDRPAAQFATSSVQPSGSGTISNETLGYVTNLPLPIVTSDGTATTSSFTINNEYDMTFALGDRINAFDVQTNLTLTRDTAGRVTNAKTQQFNSEGGSQLVVNQAYGYYGTGELQTSPQGVFTYDARGLVATRTVASGVYHYQYDELGRCRVLTYPDGHTRTQVYDGEGRIESRCYAYGSTLTRCYTTDYDAAGNPVTMTDPEGTDTIAYDALDRVMSVTRTASGATVATETYAYNALGALVTNAGVAIDDQRPALGGSGTAPAAVPNSYNGSPITLDAGGRVTSLAGTALVFNTKGALTSVAGHGMHHDMFQRIAADDAAGLVYLYDGANRSQSWAFGLPGHAGVWVQHGTWIYDGVDHPLEHYDENSNRQYYELDLAGNVRRLMAPGGGDLGGYRYTAFGESVTGATAPAAPQGAASLPVRWKGRWLMYASGVGTAGAIELYDMRARWWWPQGGVFVSMDELPLANRYTTLWGWAGENPFRWADPSGHEPLPAYTQGMLQPYFPTLDLSKVNIQFNLGSFTPPNGGVPEGSHVAGYYDWNAISGVNVVFNKSDYDPYDPQGISLIAHELVHAVQDQEYNQNSGLLGLLLPNQFKKAYDAQQYKDNYFEYAAYSLQAQVLRDLSANPGICILK